MNHLLSAILALFLLAGFGCQQKTKTEQKPIITVSLIPQKFFVDQIAGEWLDVNVMIPPGGNPHTYEPTPLQMKALSNSSAYLLIGQITFETSWMDKLVSVNPDMKVFDTSEGVEFISEEAWEMEAEENEHLHAEEAGHDHHHHAYNPHIWLSPNLVKIQADNIFKALSELYPDYKDKMEQNLNRFKTQCDSVHQQLDKQLKQANGTSYIVYHPVWTYLAKEYGLHQVSIEHNGKEATADKLKNIIDFANEKNIRIVFVQKEFSNAQAKTIAEQIKGRVVSMNPLDYNWFNTMKEFGEAFQMVGKQE
ncbi:MAG: cation ABC transporter substrate-binding protein [Bacteroidetes bacterium HGW-Bacteroidetes-4]|jgi:zinc transport system substrate-binding protein|nr:MAG: cation ABC transporter substrate-binding protein [Bacteroidetes bacterium HGW-Bacteroidetes-4]